ncbi:MAG: aspartate 1-decarboxylase [Lentisphaerae bacterium]|nr:aspartate 1-decarboxylase [Lentisphaerota bacterium]
MKLTMLKAKMHRAAVTGCELDYEGSIRIDADLLRQANILPYEKVLVANLSNGERFETYAIAGPAGSGEVCLNGATARKGIAGDRLVVFAFCELTPEEAAAHRPTVLVLDEKNRPVIAR